MRGGSQEIVTCLCNFSARAAQKIEASPQPPSCGAPAQPPPRCGNRHARRSLLGAWGTVVCPLQKPRVGYQPLLPSWPRGPRGPLGAPRVPHGPAPGRAGPPGARPRGPTRGGGGVILPAEASPPSIPGPPYLRHTSVPPRVLSTRPSPALRPDASMPVKRQTPNGANRGARVGRLLGPLVRVRDSPPPSPLRALRAPLVTKGQWLLAIHRGNVSALGARRASFGPVPHR